MNMYMYIHRKVNRQVNFVAALHPTSWGGKLRRFSQLNHGKEGAGASALNSCLCLYPYSYVRVHYTACTLSSILYILYCTAYIEFQEQVAVALEVGVLAAFCWGWELLG